MKILLFTLSMLISFSLYAQELTTDWGHRIGDSYTKQAVLQGSFDDLEIPSAGLDQVWDYSTLVEHTPFLEKIEIIDINDSSFGNFFPEADFVISNPWTNNFSTSIESFYKITEGSIYKIGYVNFTSSFIKYHYPKPSNLFAFPMTYQDSVTYEWSYGIEDSGEFIEERSGSSLLIFNGTGTVLTPEGTYENCIMLTRFRFHEDGQIRSFRHSFYHNKLSQLVLEYWQYPNVSTTGGYWFTKEIVTSNSDINTSLNLEISYNQNQLLINAPNDIELNFQILDVNGRLIEQFELDVLSGKNIAHLDHLKTAGIYFVFVSDKKTGRFLTKKISHF